MMLTSNPYFILMKPNTLEVINEIWKYRAENKSNICFTLDAGANVHVLYPSEEKKSVENFIEKRSFLNIVKKISIFVIMWVLELKCFKSSINLKKQSNYENFNITYCNVCWVSNFISNSSRNNLVRFKLELNHLKTRQNITDQHPKK